jgi:hypothetical protein
MKLFAPRLVKNERLPEVHPAARTEKDVNDRL